MPPKTRSKTRIKDVSSSTIESCKRVDHTFILQVQTLPTKLTINVQNRRTGVNSTRCIDLLKLLTAREAYFIGEWALDLYAAPRPDALEHLYNMYAYVP